MQLASGHWFMDESSLAAASAAARGIDFDATQFAAFIERTSRAFGDDEKRFVAGDDGTARVPIVGAMTKRPDYYFSLIGEGNAVYGDIVEGIRNADADPTVKQIILEIDSGGGQWDGLQGLMDAVAATKTETIAHVTDKAASAAYGVASQADRIIVNNVGAMIGSVGAASVAYISENQVITRSTAAPDKLPEPGSEALQKELDDIHEIFATSIAAGRARATGKDVSVDKVNAKFGQGALLLAKEALSVGMIDEIAKKPKARAGKSSAATPRKMGGPKAMDRAEFEAQHPQLCAAILKEGRDAGVTQERDRVEAHLEMGDSCGAMDDAVKFVCDGTEFTSKVNAKYMSAGMKLHTTNARADDETDPDGAELDADGKTVVPKRERTGAEDTDASDLALMDRVAASFGKTLPRSEVVA